MRKRQNRQLEPCRRNPTTYIWKPLWAPPEVDPFHSGHFHETLLVAQPGQQICPQYPLPNPAIVLLNPPTHHAASRLCTPLASSVLSELTALSSPGAGTAAPCASRGHSSPFVYACLLALAHTLLLSGVWRALFFTFRTRSLSNFDMPDIKHID